MTETVVTISDKLSKDNERLKKKESSLLANVRFLLWCFVVLDQVYIYQKQMTTILFFS